MSWPRDEHVELQGEAGDPRGSRGSGWQQGPAVMLALQSISPSLPSDAYPSAGTAAHTGRCPGTAGINSRHSLIQAVTELQVAAAQAGSAGSTAGSSLASARSRRMTKSMP